MWIGLWVCGGFADDWSNLFERRLNFGENLTVIFNRLFMRNGGFCAPSAADFADHWSILFERRLNFDEDLAVIFNRYLR